MSHELRTPLTAVIGFADVMRGELFGPLGSPKYHEYCRDIEASGHHLLDLIDDILDLAKVESGPLCADRGDGRSGCPGPRLDPASGRPPGPQAYRPEHAGRARAEDPGDERALKQVLVNLLTNAVKYTPAGGLIELTAGIGSSNELELVVSDTGIGIPEAELALVQEPFTQASNSQSAGEDGTGSAFRSCARWWNCMAAPCRSKATLGEAPAFVSVFPATRVLSSAA